MDKAQGIVLSGVGGLYRVLCQDQTYECKAGGRLRLEEEGLAVGDAVTIELDNQNSGFIVARQPRKNALIRPAIANIDKLFIMASEAPPITDLYLIDKMLVLCEHKGITPILLLSKSDICENERLESTYRATGYEVIKVSAVTDEGIDLVRKQLVGSISAFTGNSAIGKSSVLNRIDEQFALKIGGMSRKIERGKHTTRSVELLKVQGGGLVADTPGFSSFEITRMAYIPKDQLSECFPEIRQLVGQCRFTDCAHIKEPGCAVLSAVTEGQIASSRHESYKKLYSELAEIKAWQVQN